MLPPETFAALITKARKTYHCNGSSYCGKYGTADCPKVHDEVVKFLANIQNLSTEDVEALIIKDLQKESKESSDKEGRADRWDQHIRHSSRFASY